MKIRRVGHKSHCPVTHTSQEMAAHMCRVLKGAGSQSGVSAWQLPLGDQWQQGFL